MKIWQFAIRAAATAALCFGVTLSVQAQQRTTTVVSVESIPFMVGGIGKDDETFMRRAGKLFNLRIEFSARKDNEFVVDTALAIADLQGNPVFAMPNVGPIVNINLPDGDYRVAATYKSKTETRVVKVRGDKGQDLYFHWNGSPSPSQDKPG
jgi:hypothetical protein